MPQLIKDHALKITVATAVIVLVATFKVAVNVGKWQSQTQRNTEEIVEIKDYVKEELGFIKDYILNN